MRKILCPELLEGNYKGNGPLRTVVHVYEQHEFRFRKSYRKGSCSSPKTQKLVGHFLLAEEKGRLKN